MGADRLLTVTCYSRTGVGLVAVLLCGVASGAVAQRPQLFDSAGVHMVVYPEMPAAIPEVRHEATPWLVLGAGAHGAASHFDAANPLLNIVWLADGKLAATDRGALTLVDSSGRLRSADDQHELLSNGHNRLRYVCRFRGDSIIAIDGRDGHVGVWTGDGRFVKAFPAHGAAGRQSCLPDGSLLVALPLSPAQSDSREPRSNTREYARVRLDGAVVSRIGAFRQNTYGPISQELNIAAVGNRVYVADGSTFEVRSYSLNGTLLSIFRICAPLERISDEEWRLAGDRMFGAMPAGERRAIIARLYRPTFFPALATVLIDPTRRVWVQSYSHRREWFVFDTSGMLIGKLQLDSGVSSVHAELIAVGDQQIAVRRRRADGSSLVAFFRLSPVQ